MTRFVIVFCFVTLASCAKKADELTPDDAVQTLNFDCVPGSGAVEYIVPGDPYDINPTGYNPFNGYADPSIRKDPNANTIWYAYSYPFYKQSGSLFVPSVATHLAKSNDNGNTFSFVKELFSATSIANPANPTQQGFLDHEVVNLLPVSSGGTTNWYAARLNYFIPLTGGFAARPGNSFYISILQASSVEGLTTGSASIIGGGVTDASWNLNARLVPPALIGASFFWNEPSLYYDVNKNKIYLTMVAFVFNGAVQDVARSNVYVYATTPMGSPSSWTWTLNGTLVNQSIANELGGQMFTQVEVTTGADGKPVLLGTPSDWVSAQNDLTHKGCKVIEIQSLDQPALARSSNGKLKVCAYITASDANSLGSGAASYEATSATGLLFTKRVKTSSQLTAAIWHTRLKP